MTARRWCFTLNNPLDIECPKRWPQANIKYCLFQLEKGELEETPHIQGYVEFRNSVRLAAVKRLSSRAHWEVARGTRLQALQYCLKEETRLERPCWFNGTLWINCSIELPDCLSSLIEKETLSASKSTGESATKLRLSAIRERLLEEDCSTEDIADSDFDLWVRHYRAFERYVCLKTKPRNHAVEVHVVQGPTGTGKSRWALETFPNAYWKQRSNWWCGYSNHKTIIIDEFYGWLPFDLLLRICDRYPLLLETKGGQVQMVANTIVITSNSMPGNWYKSVAYFPSFIRRVTKWHVIPNIGIHSIYDDYVGFLAHATIVNIENNIN